MIESFNEKTDISVLLHYIDFLKNVAHFLALGKKEFK